MRSSRSALVAVRNESFLAPFSVVEDTGVSALFIDVNSRLV